MPTGIYNRTKKHKESISKGLEKAYKEGRRKIIPINYWIGKKRSKETKEKIRKSLTGRKLSKRTRKKMRESHKGRHSGENSNFWRGGTTTLINSIRGSDKYKRWRKKVFKRDNFICQECGYDKGSIIEPHHKKDIARILFENKIETIEQALKCKELWNIDNGKTLCRKCHRKTDNYGVKAIIKVRKI